MRSTTDTLGMAIPSAAKAALLSIRAARLKPCPDDCKTPKPVKTGQFRYKQWIEGVRNYSKRSCPLRCYMYGDFCC